MTSEPRTITWIASYPKSGNTWLRFLVANLVFGPQESAATLATLVPDLHELAGGFARPTQPVLIKTHFPCSARVPHIEATRAAICIVRNPADVMVSNFYYARRSGALAADSAIAWNQYVDDFITHRGDPRWSRLGMGSWTENVASWCRPDLPFPVVRLRYEDVLADPVAAGRYLAALLRPNASATEIEQAVAGASFRKMREIEESDIRSQRVGIFYKPYLQGAIDNGVRFMRGGRAGDAQTMLSEEQHARFVGAFGNLMRTLGYSTDAASLAAAPAPAG